jgi:hypothetical protein
MNSIEAIRNLGYERTGNGWHRDDGFVSCQVENPSVLAALNTLIATESERNESDRAVSMLCDERDWYHDRLDEARQKANKYDTVVTELQVCDGGQYRNDTISALTTRLRRLDAVTQERDEARAMVFDLFNQACLIGDEYDHMAISTYEDAQAALIEWGMIRPDQCKGVQE